MALPYLYRHSLATPYAFCVCSAAFGSGCDARLSAIWELRPVGLEMDLPATHDQQEPFSPRGAANCMVLTPRGHNATWLLAGKMGSGCKS
jgi:hypothetical protein